MEERLTTKEASGILGITQGAINRAIARGRLNAVKVGRDWYIPQDALNTYKDNRKKGWPKGKRRKIR